MSLTPEQLAANESAYRHARVDAIRNKRWQVETGGITVNGASIRTDETSQAKITGAVNLFANDLSLTEIDL